MEKNKNVKMVMVCGLLIAEDKVEGRLKALEGSRRLKTQLMKDQMDEDRRLAERGYTDAEIACIRHANRIRTLENMGLGTITHVRRTCLPA